MSDTTEKYCETCETVHPEFVENEDGTVGAKYVTQEELELFQATTKYAIGLMQDEMIRQINKWGVQTYNSFQLQQGGQQIISGQVDSLHYMLNEQDAKGNVEYRAKQGTITWADIFQEEMSEALGAAYEMADPEGTSDETFGELVQMATVAFVWLTDMVWQRRGDKIIEQLEVEQEARRLFSAVTLYPENDTDYDD
jgi:hypothetical protein